MITNQVAFDQIWEYFVVQGNPQSEERQSCKLRTVSGKRCAIGLLIPDELYKSEMEGEAAQDLTTKHPQLEPHLPESLFSIALQEAHDEPSSETFSQEIEIHLRQVAQDYKLTIPGG